MAGLASLESTTGNAGAAAAHEHLAVIQGHGGVGVVEAVGPEVRRACAWGTVSVCLGRRSAAPVISACAAAPTLCQFLSRIGADDLVAVAETRDGTPVYENSHIGGLAELMVTFEEWVVPVFTKATAADLGMVCSQRVRGRPRRHRRADVGRPGAGFDGGGRRLRSAGPQCRAGRASAARRASSASTRSASVARRR